MGEASGQSLVLADRQAEVNVLSGLGVVSLVICYQWDISCIFWVRGLVHVTGNWCLFVLLRYRGKVRNCNAGFWYVSCLC